VSAQPGFDEAFPSLFAAARAAALRILGSWPEAEDCAAEALARALVRWDRIGDLPHRDAWVVRVSLNLAIDLLRKRRDLPGSEAPDVGVDAQADLVAVRHGLAAALRTLPRRQQEATLLRHMAGLPEHEVAAAMGLSLNSARTLLKRARRRLRTELAPWRDGEMVVDERDVPIDDREIVVDEREIVVGSVVALQDTPAVRTDGCEIVIGRRAMNTEVQRVPRTT
jgi:RNA polymerase sigma-70 factor, ECF subfamily